MSDKRLFEQDVGVLILGEQGLATGSSGQPPTGADVPGPLDMERQQSLRLLILAALDQRLNQVRAVRNDADLPETDLGSGLFTFE
jgi:hypothetical protein